MAKEKNVFEWYLDTIKKSNFIDLTLTPGLNVYMQNSYKIWEIIKEHLNEELSFLGFENVYFPMFIPLNLFKKQKHHFRVFESELTHVKTPKSKNKTIPLVVRPTSEAIMYDSFSNWIESHHDLPLLVNQFCSVVRWETRKDNVPLIRGNEFLWQESHSVHSNQKETEWFVKKLLNVYDDLIQGYLALPTIKGLKPGHRKFPGAVYTLALESLMPDGKAIQMATSHYLGKNFSKPQKVSFKDKKGRKEQAFQASNGCTTRLIGAMLMFHGDDKGFVLPPKVADRQIVFVQKPPQNLIQSLITKGIRAKFDARKNLSVKEKIDDAVLNGVPLIVSLKKGKLKVLIRDKLSEEIVSKNNFAFFAKGQLTLMQKRLFSKASDFLKKHTFNVKDKEKFENILSNNKGLALANWCATKSCAKNIKNKTSGSLRIVKKEFKNKKQKCIYCSKPAKFQAYFSEAY